MENISKKITLDKPSVSIDWSLDVDACRKLLSPYNAIEDSSDEYTTFALDGVTFLGVTDLYLVLRNDINPTSLQRIELQYNAEDYEIKLQAINEAIEAAAGQKPTPSDNGVNGLMWQINDVTISTYIHASAWGEVAMLVLEKNT
jgi:hypothetical protein